MNPQPYSSRLVGCFSLKHMSSDALWKCWFPLSPSRMMLKWAGLDHSTSKRFFLPWQAGQGEVTEDNSVLSTMALQGQVMLRTKMTLKNTYKACLQQRCWHPPAPHMHSTCALVLAVVYSGAENACAFVWALLVWNEKPSSNFPYP